MGTVRTSRTTCAKLDDFGRGICYIDGKTVFVDDLLPGETADVQTVFQNGKLSLSKVVKRCSNSKSRSTPRCPYYGRCGGCSLQHLDYQAQLEYKKQKVKDNIHKFGGLDVEIDEVCGLDDPWHFRNKVQVPVGRFEKHLRSGFYQEQSHRLIPIDDCLIESSLATRIRKVVVEVADRFGLEAYDEDKRTGFLRHILIKVSEVYQETMVVLVTARAEFYGANNFVREVLKKDERIKTIVQNVNPHKTNVILGDRTKTLYGSGKIKDQLCGLDFLISAKSFYQTNLKMTERLYNTAIDLAGLTKEDRVLDAYCGTGTIGLVASRYAKHVTGIEIEHSAILDAKLNKKINHIENIDFIEGDSTAVLQNSDLRFDVAFIDPPRAGTTEELVDSLLRAGVKKLIYISCNPATLGRDLKYMAKFATISQIKVFDMFPNSYHVECCVLLEMKEQKG